MMVGQKAALKSKPKIYIADAAIRSAVLMLDDVLSDDGEMGIMVETAVYKHVVSFYINASSAHVGYYRKAQENQKEVDVVIEFPKGKILCEVKYRNSPSVSASDAIIALSNEENTKVLHSFLILSDKKYHINRGWQHPSKFPFAYHWRLITLHRTIKI